MVSIFKFYLLSINTMAVYFLHCFLAIAVNHATNSPVIKDHELTAADVLSICITITLPIFSSFTPLNSVSIATMSV